MMKIIINDPYYPAVALSWLAVAQDSIKQRGRFDVALSGGRTPERLLQQLRQAPEATFLWSSIHFWFGDERCVPPAHSDSNFGMASRALLDHISYGAAHRILGEIEPQAAASRYAKELKGLPQRDGWPVFDLVMLGLGTDGHIASLFPDSDPLRAVDHSVSAAFIPSVNSWRISLTLPVIQRARSIMLLATGASKRPILKAVVDEGRQDLPVSRIVGLPQLNCYLDQAAAVGLQQQRPTEPISTAPLPATDPPPPDRGA